MSTSNNLPFDTALSGEEIMRQFFPTSPYVAYQGIQLTEMQPDMAILTMPFRDELVTIGTTVHGGAIASLIDTAAMVAAWAGATVPANGRGTTVGLTVNYLAAAQSEDLKAIARVLRRGRSLVYLDVEVQNPAGMLVAKGLATYKLG